MIVNKKGKVIIMYAYQQMRTGSAGSFCDPCHTKQIDQLPVGMAYVPWQEFKDLYDPQAGLCHGTIFKELDYPFCGKRGNVR